MSVDGCRATVRYWRHCADDVLAAEDTSYQHHQRDLRLSRTFDGAWDIAGRLEPVTGELLNNRLNQGWTVSVVRSRPPSATAFVPPEWSAPGDAGMSLPGLAPPEGWDLAHPPDPDVDELAYRRWQDAVVRKRVAELTGKPGSAA